jgi:drug/metabolite transporter (DMT)-like permease
MLVVGRVAFGQRARAMEVAGLVMGFAGLALLVELPGSARVDPAGVAVVIAGALCWATGSHLAGRLPLPRRALVGSAMEMLAGGVVLTIMGLVSGEASRVDLAAVSVRSIVGLVYLIVFGSLVAFTAYSWLLQHARLTLVSTYAYVNPVVAVFLGVLILNEPLAPRTLVSGAVIVAAVALIVSGRRARVSEDGVSGAV